MIVRAMLPVDRRYVVATWAQSFADRAPWSQRLVRDRHSSVVDCLLDDGARVVVLGTNDGTVHAWACGEGPTLHYVYVPPELRGRGVARRVITALLDGYPDHADCSHPWPCRDGAHAPRCKDLLCRGRGQRFRFNPYALTRCKEAA